jgi:hypothetical protein
MGEPDGIIEAWRVVAVGADVIAYRRVDAGDVDHRVRKPSGLAPIDRDRLTIDAEREQPG